MEISLSGALGAPQPVVALLDTGFSGFLSLPIKDAFAANLSLFGTTSMTLADGSVHSTLTCIGAVHLDQEIQAGIVSVEPSSDIALVGVEFLHKFSRTLVLDVLNGSVALVPPPGGSAAAAAP